MTLRKGSAVEVKPNNLPPNLKVHERQGGKEIAKLQAKRVSSFEGTPILSKLT